MQRDPQEGRAGSSALNQPTRGRAIKPLQRLCLRLVFTVNMADGCRSVGKLLEVNRSFQSEKQPVFERRHSGLPLLFLPVCG